MAAKMEKTRHPGIYRRGGRYVVVWRHRGKQHKSFHRTLAEAREAKGQRASGDSRPDSREPFTAYASRWLETYRGRTARGLSERTRRAYRCDMELWVLPFFDGYRLADVEAPDVRAFVGHLEDSDLRPGTIRKVLSPVKAMYATAVEDGAVRANPTREVRVGGSADPGREVRAMTRAELGRLLAKTPARWLLLFELLAHTGLRISEAAGLEWRDIEFDEEDQTQARLRVRRQDCRGEGGALKSDRSRRDLPLSPNMARRLWELGADQPATARVFTMDYGQPLQYSNLRRRVLLPTTEAAGLGAYVEVVRDGAPTVEWKTWVTFHTLRHTCASLLFEAGRDVAQVAAWLGHSDPGFTLRTYVHLMDDGVGDAAFLDDAVGVRHEELVLPAANTVPS
jgi:integrase